VGRRHCAAVLNHSLTVGPVIDKKKTLEVLPEYKIFKHEMVTGKKPH
jgi:hypothetical protein